MKEITVAASFVGSTLLGLFWLAATKCNVPNFLLHHLYNSTAKVSKLHDQTACFNQTLKQKMLTVRSISRNERQMVAKTPFAIHY
jgi:hypothetical protein